MARIFGQRDDDEGWTPEQLEGFRKFEEHNKANAERIRQDQIALNQHQRERNLPVTKFRSTPTYWPEIIGNLGAWIFFAAVGLAGCGVIWVIGWGLNTYFDSRDATAAAGSPS